jgi:hypothetical protein
MPSIPKPVLSALLILLGIAGISGCASSKDAEIASLKRLLAAQRERIAELRLNKADMQRVIDLKTADAEREKQARLQAERERDLRPLVVSGDGIQLTSQAHANSDAARSDSGARSQSAWRDAHATSEIVRQAQHVLKEAYYYHGPLNGVYGPQTRRAIAAYQRAKGLATGGLTVETLRSLGIEPPKSPITADVR